MPDKKVTKCPEGTAKAQRKATYRYLFSLTENTIGLQASNPGSESLDDAWSADEAKES
jgi:hypothetical protein